jgi:uncharacterized protein
MTQQTESNVPPVVPLVTPSASPSGGVLVYHTPRNYVPTPDERSMAMLVWLLGIVSGWVGPLIIWLIKREQSKFVDFHGKQSLFLHIVVVALMIPMMILMFIPLVGCVIFPLFMLLGVGLLVVQIVLAVKANSGEWYRMPVVGQWV